MGRTVALKVLPFAAVMDEKAITRFKNEARARRHVAPRPYCTGSRSRQRAGFYYYAMALIEGLTLAEVIDDLKQRPVLNRNGADEGELLVDQVVSHRSGGAANVESGSSGQFDRQPTLQPRSRSHPTKLNRRQCG